MRQVCCGDLGAPPSSPPEDSIRYLPVFLRSPVSCSLMARFGFSAMTENPENLTSQARCKNETLRAVHGHTGSFRMEDSDSPAGMKGVSQPVARGNKITNKNETSLKLPSNPSSSVWTCCTFQAVRRRQSATQSRACMEAVGPTLICWSIRSTVLGRLLGFSKTAGTRFAPASVGTGKAHL